MSIRFEDMMKKQITESIENEYNHLQTDEEKDKFINRLDQLDLGGLMQKMITTSSDAMLKSMRETMFEQVLSFRSEEEEFLARQKQKWNHAFATSEALYIMNLEFAEEYQSYISQLDESQRADKKWRYLALQHIHGRALQIFLEIITLMENGFADGAYARWRTMYELAIVCDFIANHDEETAKTYYESSETDERYYDWAKTSGEFDEKVKGHIRFSNLEDKSKLNTGEWNSQYQLANKIVHATPQGTFKRLSNNGKQSIIPVGRSDYGLTTPGEHSAITLVQITTMFGCLFKDFDSLLYIIIQNNWINIVREAYFKVHDEIFPDDEPLLPSLVNRGKQNV